MESHIAHIPESCMPHRNINRYTGDYLEIFWNFFFFFLVEVYSEHIHSILSKTKCCQFSYVVQVHQLVLEALKSNVKVEFYEQYPIPRFYSFS